MFIITSRGLYLATVAVTAAATMDIDVYYGTWHD